ncbi:Atp25p NDAI_0H02220 [Naumovozyma dairenensis CBS 421]|uniref:ATPase synthesis protein 25 n=1 Tax=Naumovozyma dairenensis (strain ATCC 10597 / BCRC 20456 / CBS 421 / NBRC 0211 / NRRL Y-12639) TaxID=1071378 RepID=G0WF35_NAUDC|nr:hypothetical protein NDAI_0H02220 [Naumovozyma dairenensis CBS 421]CCD26396.1 hypothetical protein NDAI_0H02220 [Naumovozyma dairenensis CBS 421]
MLLRTRLGVTMVSKKPQLSIAMSLVPMRYNSIVAKPWYLVPKPKKETVLEEIEYPKESPSSLTEITSELQKLGLTDVKIFDQRPNNKGILVVSTTKSIAHSNKSSIELNKFLKNRFNSLPDKEGLISSTDTKKLQRRLERRKKIKANFNNKQKVGKQDNWVMIKCHVDDIFVNMITAERRKELNLEELWATTEEEREYYQDKAAKDYQYTKQQSTVEDDNILAGLRRLAYQRRQYSTTSSSRRTPTLLNKFIKENEFENADQLLHSEEGFFDLDVLSRLKVIYKHRPHSNIENNVNIPNWKCYFDKHWPLILPKDGIESEKYWKLRLQFLTSLHKKYPQLYTTRCISKDYFLLKKSNGFQLTTADFVAFLKSLLLTPCINKQSLIERNKTIVEMLSLYLSSAEVSMEAIITNPEVISLLLRSLINDDRTIVLQNPLQELLVYFKTRGWSKKPQRKIIISILDTLFELRDWKKVFLFWNTQISRIGPDSDDRPWAHFIHLFNETNDLSTMKKLVTEGHLLQLKRFNTPIDENLRKNLEELFNKVDPEEQYFENLKLFLMG